MIDTEGGLLFVNHLPTTLIWMCRLGVKVICVRLNLADVGGLDASALAFAEGHVESELDGQTSHGSCGQGFDLGHGLHQTCLGAVGLQRDLVI